MPTNAIKSTFISFIRRFSHAQQLERAWAAVHKPHFNLLSLQGCGCNWPFRGNSSWSNQAVAQLRADAFILVLTWLTEGSLAHLVVDALPQDRPPISCSQQFELGRSSEPLTPTDGAALPKSPAGLSHPSPPGQSTRPLLFFWSLWQHQPSSSKALCVRVCKCVRACIHACVRACTQGDTHVRFAILPPTE